MKHVGREENGKGGGGWERSQGEKGAMRILRFPFIPSLGGIHVRSREWGEGKGDGKRRGIDGGAGC